MPNSARGERSTPSPAARGNVGAGAEDDNVDDRGGDASGAIRPSSSSVPYGSNDPVGGDNSGAALGVGAGVDRLGEAETAGDEVAVRANVGGAAVEEEAAAAARL